MLSIFISKRIDLFKALQCHKNRTDFKKNPDYSDCYIDETEIPTIAPSVSPTITPSSYPSLLPSPDSTCLNEILGSTFYIPEAGACWRVEVFQNGTLEGDFSDPSCSKDKIDFNSNGVFSIFDFSYGNVAYFKDGPNAYSGTFEFKEDSSVSSQEHKIKGWNPSTKEYDLEVTLPSCQLA